MNVFTLIEYWLRKVRSCFRGNTKPTDVANHARKSQNFIIYRKILKNIFRHWEADEYAAFITATLKIKKQSTVPLVESDSCKNMAPLLPGYPFINLFACGTGAGVPEHKCGAIGGVGKATI